MLSPRIVKEKVHRQPFSVTGIINPVLQRHTVNTSLFSRCTEIRQSNITGIVLHLTLVLFFFLLLPPNSNCDAASHLHLIEQTLKTSH